MSKCPGQIYKRLQRCSNSSIKSLKIETTVLPSVFFFNLWFFTIKIPNAIQFQSKFLVTHHFQFVLADSFCRRSKRSLQKRLWVSHCFFTRFVFFNFWPLIKGQAFGYRLQRTHCIDKAPRNFRVRTIVLITVQAEWLCGCADDVFCEGGGKDECSAKEFRSKLNEMEQRVPRGLGLVTGSDFSRHV